MLACSIWVTARTQAPTSRTPGRFHDRKPYRFVEKWRDQSKMHTERLQLFQFKYSAFNEELHLTGWLALAVCRNSVRISAWTSPPQFHEPPHGNINTQIRLTEWVSTLAPRLRTGQTPYTGDRESDGCSEHDAGPPAALTGVWFNQQAAAAHWKRVRHILLRMRKPEHVSISSAVV